MCLIVVFISYVILFRVMTELSRENQTESNMNTSISGRQEMRDRVENERENCGVSTNKNTISKISSKEISALVTLILMASMYLLIYFPDSLLWALYYYLWFSEREKGGFMFFGEWALILDKLCIIPHCCNFFIYFARIRIFRNYILCRL